MSDDRSGARAVSAFIARAVLLHDELVAALRDVADDMLFNVAPNASTMAKVRAVLEKADTP